MTTLSRWEPLAKEVMRELALGDDPVRLEVLERALAGAAQATRTEVAEKVRLVGIKYGNGGHTHRERMLLALASEIERLSDDEV